MPTHGAVETVHTAVYGTVDGSVRGARWHTGYNHARVKQGCFETWADTVFHAYSPPVVTSGVPALYYQVLAVPAKFLEIRDSAGFAQVSLSPAKKILEVP